MASGSSPPEPQNEEMYTIRPQRSWWNPSPTNIYVIYNRRTHGKFVAQMKFSIPRLLQKINIEVSLGFRITNGSIEETAVRIRSQNGEMYTVVRDQNGGRYQTTLVTVMSKLSSRTLLS